MERSVFGSFEAVSGDEFSFLGERRNVVVSRLPLFAERLAKLRALASPPGYLHRFETLTPELALPECSRHRPERAGDIAWTDAGETGRLSVAMVHGSFDPFHLGHLFMGLDAVCDGSCDFAVYMPNADRERGGTTVKLDKGPFAWRARTALSGGVDDLFPALRYSSFGWRGGTVESHIRLLEANRPLLERLDRFDLLIVIGSDILHRKGFSDWTNRTYREILESVALPALGIRFKVVERYGYPVLREPMDALDFPWVSVKEVSFASSTAIRDDPIAAVWLYPGGLLPLESYLLYGQRANQALMRGAGRADNV